MLFFPLVFVFLLMAVVAGEAQAACSAAPTAATSDAMIRFKTTAAYGQVVGLGTPVQGDLVYDTTNSVLKLCDGTAWDVITTTAPAGSTGYVQFNSAGAFGSDSGLFWDNTNKRLGIGTTSVSGVLHVYDSAQDEEMKFYGRALTLNMLSSAVPSNVLPFIEWRNAGTRYAYMGLGSVVTSPKHIDLTLENGAILYINGGNIGIGTIAPQATLDVYGYARLKINASAPVACSATYEGSIAYTGTTTHYLCFCNGTSWVKFTDNTTACTW